MPDHTAHLVRHFHAEVEEVFDAWTTPSLLAQWYAPNPALPVEFDGSVEAGSGYRLLMGGQYAATGSYHVVERPRLLEFTWRWSHEADAPDSLVRVEIDRTADGTTRLTLDHSGLASTEEAENHAEGWDLSLNRLVVLLAH